MTEFKRKFVAYVDVLGFKEMVHAAEEGKGRPLAEILQLLEKLGTRQERKRFEEHGPTTCPCSPYIDKHLDFRITQISDCVVVSSEVSPVGLINLMSHCFGAVLELAIEGIMCRGFVTMGTIFHTDTQVIGSAYVKAYKMEPGVTAFKLEADERGTPLVEIDNIVRDYVENCGDSCVKEMFSRQVKADGETLALFPFQRLMNQFMIAGLGIKFDAARYRHDNQVLRDGLKKVKTRILQYVDPTNSKAVQKANHYIRAFDTQIDVCDRTDAIIDEAEAKLPAHMKVPSN